MKIALIYRSAFSGTRGICLYTILKSMFSSRIKGTSGRKLLLAGGSTILRMLRVNYDTNLRNKNAVSSRKIRS